MIRLATVGTGAIVGKFLAAMRLTERYEHTAVYSRTRETGEAFAAKCGAPAVYTDLLKMAKSDIDAVYIASPNRFHAEQSRLFLENGKHVLCEKPITSSAEEYRELKALADQKGLVYMEAIMSRHVFWRQAVRNAIAEIGTVRYARLDYGQRSTRLDSFLAGEHQNIFDMSMHAGGLMDLGVYCVYGAVDLFGMPRRITASANFFDNGADHAGSAILSYEDFPVTLTYSKAGQSVSGSEIVGDRGSVTLKMISQYIGVDLHRDGVTTEIVGLPDRSEVMRGEAERFADYIGGNGRADYADASELTLAVHTCMDAVKQSAGIVYPD